MDGLDIRPLTADRLPDLAALFGLGGDPKRCWCSFFRVRNADIINGTAEENRSVLERSLEATAAEERAPGLVAYHDGIPIGWVSVGPRDDYPRLRHSRVLGPIDERPTWSIVCFVVARGHRGKGVAAALLDAAVSYAREHGATLVEGYPADPADETHLARIRLQGHAGDVRTCRVQRRGAATGEPGGAREAHRPPADPRQRLTSGVRRGSLAGERSPVDAPGGAHRARASTRRADAGPRRRQRRIT